MDTDRPETVTGPEGPQLSTIERNISVNRRVVEAFNRGGMEEAAAYFAEDIQVYDPDLPGELRGRAEVLDVFNEMLTGFDSVVVHRVDQYPVGDRIVSVIHTVGSGEGKRGEVDVEFHDAHVTTFRDGLVSYWRVYGDAREAFADVGLDPDDPGPPYAESPKI